MHISLCMRQAEHEVFNNGCVAFAAALDDLLTESVLLRNGHPNVRAGLDGAAQVVNILEKMHTVDSSLVYVHGDVKAQNVLLKRDASCKCGVSWHLCDMGSTHSLRRRLNGKLQELQSIDAGTVGYKPFESVFSNLFTPGNDQFAVGRLTCDFISGKRQEKTMKQPLPGMQGNIGQIFDLLW